MMSIRNFSNLCVLIPGTGVNGKIMYIIQTVMYISPVGVKWESM